MKPIFFLFATLFLFTSCNEFWRVRNIANQTSRMAGGQQTNYSKTYEFSLDSLVSQDIYMALDAYMSHKRWYVTSEGDNHINFEFRSSQAARETTNKQQLGRANFRVFEQDNILELKLQLQGNYNYGRRENAWELYTDLKDYLYGR